MKLYAFLSEDLIPTKHYVRFRRRPAPFEQNEIPLKNSVESMDCAHQKIRRAKLVSVSTWSWLRLSHLDNQPAAAFLIEIAGDKPPPLPRLLPTAREVCGTVPRAHTVKPFFNAFAPGKS